MYILELIYEYLKNTKIKQKKYDPMYQEDLEKDEKECNHCFLPLDSSGEFFACKYCGLVVPKDKLIK